MIRVAKAATLLAALLCMGRVAAAQWGSLWPDGSHRAEHHRARAARPPEIPQQVAPPQESFAAFPQSQQAAPSSPPSDCDLRLGEIAAFRPLGKLIAPGECGAADAVVLGRVILPDGSRVAIAPAATLRCSMAEAVAHWVREDVDPAAVKAGAPLRALENLGSYECRGRDRVRGATLSEHGRANALDVRAFKLANGKRFVLVDPGVPWDFRQAVRASACTRFTTVLGPGSDADHAEHVHVDLAQRRNNYKICEWDVGAPPASAPVVRAPAPVPVVRVPAPASAPAKVPVSAEAVPLPLPRPILRNGKTQERPRTRRHARCRSLLCAFAFPFSERGVR